MNPEKAFWFPVTFSDSILRQNPKHHFRNYLIDVSKACESKLLNEARWIIDTIQSWELSKLKKHTKND